MDEPLELQETIEHDFYGAFAKNRLLLAILQQVQRKNFKNCHKNVKAKS